MFWQLLLLAAALGAAYYRWSRRRLYRLARELPSGLKEYPVLGHAHMFLGSSEAQMKAIQNMGRAANLQGGLASVWLSNRLYVTMTDPEAIDVVTKTCLEKDNFLLKLTRTVIGNGSLFAPVNIWHPRRKIMAPFFRLTNLNQFVPTFYKKSSFMVDLMKLEVGGGNFSIWKYMTPYTFDAIMENAFGTNIYCQENPEHFIIHAIDALLHMVSQRCLQPWLHPDFVYRRLPVYKQFHTLRQKAYDFTDEIIQLTRKKLTVDDPKDKYSNGKKHFLDVVIQTSGGLGKCYSDIELREECIVMITAANDTSAVGSSFTSVLLSRYPDVQDKVYQELREVIGDSSRDITREDLLRLTYLEAVIKESLRLYPPIPLITREIHNDTKLRKICTYHCVCT